MRMFNEKPSKYKNLGQDIINAKRHSFNTYETTEQKEAKERKKQQKKNLEQLKKTIVGTLTEENYKDIIKDYEFKKTLASIPDYAGSQTYSKESLQEFKNYVLSLRGLPEYDSLARKFNRVSRLINRLSYRLRYEDALSYFDKKTKGTFTEINGIQKSWKLNKEFDQSVISYLSESTKAVQFGNSLKESEREYCMQNLAESLKLLNKYFNFDFKTVGFSYGARGVRGSIAHYQDSLKVLAFNRGWDGALVHELGHAIDYSLDLVSYQLPRSVWSKYADQLRTHKIGNRSYYLNNKEIFARLFEQYVKKMVPELSQFMQHTFNELVMPELDSEALEFMNQVLKPILK